VDRANRGKVFRVAVAAPLETVEPETDQADQCYTSDDI
jgi:hypothetical protein